MHRLVNLTGEVTVVNTRGCTADFGRSQSGEPVVDPTITVRITCMKSDDNDVTITSSSTVKQGRLYVDGRQFFAEVSETLWISIQ